MYAPAPDPDGSVASACLVLNDAACLKHYRVRSGPAYGWTMLDMSLYARE